MATKKEPTTGLRKLLEDQIADIYFAEKQLVKVLPRMLKAATNEELRAALESHLDETRGQVERLEQVFEALGIPPKAKPCVAMVGILHECAELMREFADDEALDAALVDGAKKVEHYEIATYSGLVAWAEQLGLDAVAGMLKENLDEEQAADDELTSLCEAVISEATGASELELVEADVDERPSKAPKSAAKMPSMGAKASTNGTAKRTARTGGKR